MFNRIFANKLYFNNSMLTTKKIIQIINQFLLSTSVKEEKEFHTVGSKRMQLQLPLGENSQIQQLQLLIREILFSWFKEDATSVSSRRNLIQLVPGRIL